MAAVANVAARERSAVHIRMERHDAYTISNSPSLIMPVKALWHRLVDSLANRLEERRAQAELALMTPRERFDLDVAHGNLIVSEFARMSQCRETIPAGN